MLYRQVARASRYYSFAPSHNSEKRVRSSAVKLLVCHWRRDRETHHREKLREELRAEMPPRVPEKIFRRRRQTTYRRAFQVEMELVDDDERLRSFSALLNDAKRVAAVEQHRAHHCDVEFSECPQANGKRRRNKLSLWIVGRRD